MAFFEFFFLGVPGVLLCAFLLVVVGIFQYSEKFSWDFCCQCDVQALSTSLLLAPLRNTCNGLQPV